MTSKDRNFKRTRIATVLFLAPVLLYIILPLVTTLPEPIKHLLLTLTAIMAVHLLDRLWLFNDVLESIEKVKQNIKSDISTEASGLLQRIEQIGKGIGIKVSYLERQHNSANLFNRAKEVIKAAEESILVLNSPEYEIDEEERLKPSTERDLYYEALLDRVNQANGKIKYERLLQVHTGQKVSSVIISQEYRKHLHRMLDEKEKNPGLPIHLVKVKAKRLATFVLVDGKYLILESNEYTGSRKIRMHGVFIIEDPFREVTRHFSKFFEDIKWDSEGYVRRDELPSISENESGLVSVVGEQSKGND